MISRSLLTILAFSLVGGLALEASAAQMKYFERVEVGETAQMPVSAGKKSGAKKKSAKKSAAARKALATKKVAARKGKAAGKSAGGGGKQVGREFVFDGSTVSGRYHSAGEAVAKVEQEKKMNDLVGMRRDFKDRLAAERDRLKAQAAE